MKEETTRCDVCDCIIEQLGENCMVYPGVFDGQMWPTEDGNKDVCDKCCGIFIRAAGLGMIEFDVAQFYEAAGYVWSGEHWRYEPENDDAARSELQQAIGEAVGLCSSG